MKTTKELQQMQLGETAQVTFDSPRNLHSFSSIICYVNRVYFKQEGKVIRATYDYRNASCVIRCEAYKG